MKMIIIILIVLALPLSSFSQRKSLSALQDKYQDKANCFTLSFTGNILDALAGSLQTAFKPEVKSVVKKIQSLNILSVSAKAQGYSSRDLRRLKAEIRKQSFEEVISVKSKKGNIRLLIKDHQGKINECIILLDNAGKGFTALDFRGTPAD